MPRLASLLVPRWDPNVLIIEQKQSIIALHIVLFLTYKSGHYVILQTCLGIVKKKATTIMVVKYRNFEYQMSCQSCPFLKKKKLFKTIESPNLSHRILFRLNKFLTGITLVGDQHTSFKLLAPFVMVDR